MKQLRIAIIGQGRSGRDIHGKFFLGDTSGKYKVVAVVDAIPLRRERAKKEFGCEAYADYRELFARKDIDLVVNCSFSYQHYSITLDLLEHGFPVVVEKPFGRYARDCLHLMNTAKEKGVMLNVFQQSRFAPYYTEIKKVIASGVLGTLKQISVCYNGFSRRWDWQCSQRYWGGSLLNSGPHPLDQALDLLDFDPNIRVAFSKLDKVNTSGDAEDYCKIILTAPGKPVVDVEISSCNAYSPYTYVIQASNGCLCATHQKINYKYFIPENEPVRPLVLEPLQDENGYPAYCTEKLNWIEKEIIPQGSVFDVAVEKYYNMIYQHLVEGKEMEVQPWQVLQQIRLVEQIHADNPLPVLY